MDVQRVTYLPITGLGLSACDVTLIVTGITSAH